MFYEKSIENNQHPQKLALFQLCLLIPSHLLHFVPPRIRLVDMNELQKSTSILRFRFERGCLRWRQSEGGDGRVRVHRVRTLDTISEAALKA